MSKRFLTFSLVALVVFSSGCLKDEKYMEIDKTAPVAEFPIGGPGVVENSYDITAFLSQTVDTSIAINIASPQPLDKDVQVTVQVTPTIITEYNTVEGTSFTPLPIANYSISNYTITIPKGYRIGRIPIRFFFSQFDLSQSYAFALQIVSAPGLTISGNFNKFLWTFNVKNKYDGIYRIKGYGYLGTTNTTAPYTFNIPCGDPNEVAVSTSGASSVRLDYQPLYRGGTIIGFSNILPEITFNSSDVVTNVSGYGASTAFSFPNPNTPGYNSRYETATKTIYVSYGIPLNAAWSVIDTLTYCRPR